MLADTDAPERVALQIAPCTLSSSATCISNCPSTEDTLIQISVDVMRVTSSFRALSIAAISLSIAAVLMLKTKIR